MIGRTMTGAEFIVEALVQSGVTHVYGGHGGSVVGIIDAIVAHSKLTWVYCRCEVNASQQAAAYAKLHNRLGVCIATSGPGITHMLSGAIDAQQDRVPMLVLSGTKDSASLAYSDFQDVNQAAIFRSGGLNFSESVANIEQVMPLMRNAISHAVQRAECVHLSIASDVALQSIADAPLHFCVGNAVMRFSLHHHTSPEEIRDCADFLLHDHHLSHLCICLGWRARDCGAAIEKLAEALQVPILTRFDAKGAVNEDHPLAYGVLGVYGNVGTRSAVDILADCDTVIAVCVPDLAGLVAGKNGLQIRRCVQIETSLMQGDSLRYQAEVVLRTSALHDDLCALATILEPEALAIRQSLGTSQNREKPPGTPSTFLRGSCHVATDLSTEEFCHPGVFFQQLSKILQPNAVICADVGDNALWLASSFVAKRGQTFLTSEHMGIMGYALNAGLASCTRKSASHKDPHQTLIVTGDGGCQMSLNELATHKDHGTTNTLCVVVQNGRLGRVQNEKWGASAKGNGCAIGSPDFIKLFEAFGYPNGLSVSTSNLADIDRVIEQGWILANTQGMCVIVLHQDERVSPVMHKLAVNATAKLRTKFVEESLTAPGQQKGSAKRLLPDTLPCQKAVDDYLRNLKKLDKSEAHWVDGNEMQRSEFSIAEVLEKLVKTLPGYPEGSIFVDEGQRTAFNRGWDEMARKNLSGEHLRELLEEGRSNGYLLQFVVLAIPPGKAYPLHAHPNHELVVAVAGECRELRSPVLLPPQDLHRCQMAFAGDRDPKGFSSELMQKTVFHDQGESGRFADGVFASALGDVQKETAVNMPGSVHLSYTSEDVGSLLFVLWSGTHADIQACNFKQQSGVELLARRVAAEFCEECPCLQASKK